MAKVLIVDDERGLVKLLTTLLSLDGYEVESVGRGAEVLPALAQHTPDIVLMDYHLTDMDGLSVVRQMRADPLYANLPVIVASGLDVAREAMEAGATRFLGKPYDPSELTDLIGTLIGESGA